MTHENRNIHSPSPSSEPLFEEVDYEEEYGSLQSDGPLPDPGTPGFTDAVADQSQAEPQQPDQGLSTFTPVPRSPLRHDGWTAEKQRQFIGALADTESVTQAVKYSGMSRRNAYAVRRSPGALAFAQAWEMAIRQASRTLADIAFERAVDGVDEPVFDKDGTCTHVRRKYNDRLVMFLLRAHNPAQYGVGDERTVYPRHEDKVQEWAEGFTPVTAAIAMLEDDDGDDDDGLPNPTVKPKNG